ncbi:MAG: serine/threonine-protein kinase, partial [Planctomycetota bacterium]
MIGRTIAHYEITGKLGEGAMGEVYRATDSRLKRDVAIKLLSSRLAADPELVARLRREAEVLASLNHTNIGQIYGIEPSGDSLALVLELVEGQTLDERLKEGPLPLERALKVAQQIAAALETAHEAGIIHRDLKPANVKRTPDGDVKVLDFGLAKGTQLNLNHTDLTADGAVIGTPAYMSPEQVAGKPLDRRTDIWSFGCVFYEMLTGSKAFGGDSVGSLFAAIATEPPDLEQVAKAPRPVRNLIERCLRKDP